MKRFSTLILGLMVAGSLFAERPEGIIAKATSVPVIDGVIDAVWEKSTPYNIERNFKEELPTLGGSGETTWKMLWDESGLYVMLNVADDSYLPSYAVTPKGYSWDYDQPELYFDVNAVLEGGPSGAYGAGHYQIAPAFVESKINGEVYTESNGVIWAVKVTGSNYVVEYFVPLSMLKDMDKVTLDLTRPVGFDVTFIDRDPGDAARKRAVWANDGSTGLMSETNGNMDESGIITFDGAQDATLIEKITLNTGNITTDNGTLKMVANILPADATFKELSWSVSAKEGNTGRASIDSKGVLTAISDGTVRVTAVATDGSYTSGSVDVTISGQVVKKEELSYIKNGDFKELVGSTPSYWNFGSGSAQVVDGVLEVEPASVMTNPWDYKILQYINVPFELKDLEYVLTFKAWADAERDFPLKIEDSNNGWPSYGTSSDPTSNGNTSWNMNINTEPTVYELHMTFANMLETCVQNFNWQVGLSTTRIYVDSVTLVSVADMGLISTSAPVYKQNANIQLYPNPVQTELTISKIDVANSKVGVYNSVGQKLMEKTATGTQAKFDVANLRKGMYFVRFSDGSRQKFIKN
jgi:hypothetical protein